MTLQESIIAVLRDSMPCPRCNGHKAIRTRHQDGEESHVPCTTCKTTGIAQFDDSDKFILKWQYSGETQKEPLLGHFYRSLAEAIARADDVNLNRLARGFPTEVEGFYAGTAATWLSAFVLWE